VKTKEEAMDTVADAGGKYLTFRLAGEEYGMAILKVREIIGLMDITAVPRAPEHIRGVVNLRGKIVPVLDLRKKFGLPAVELRKENCIITAMVEGGQGAILVGLLVDSVSEVLSVQGAEIEPVPALHDVKLPFVLGLAKGQGRVRILLDIEKVVQEESLEGVLELSGQAPAAA
jgi:purine-binding chemotaxis protein CheW